MRTTRRRFLRSAALTLAIPAWLRAAAPARRLPLAFSTLGCPRWPWKTILERAADWGYAAIEVRGILGELDLTKCPEFQASALAGTLRDLEALDLRVVGLGSSVRLHEPAAAQRTAQLEEGRRFIDLAARLGAPYVRVFGDKYVANEPKAATLERVIAGLRELGGHAKGSGVTVLLESHGDFNDSNTLGAVIAEVDLPTVGLLWDAHHTVVLGHETPATTWGRLGRSIRHVHLKDSRPEGKDVRYVLTGTGTVPVRDTARALVQGGYRGYYSFEWEKLWHPEIEEPEVAFPHFVKVIAGYLNEAGFKAG